MPENTGRKMIALVVICLILAGGFYAGGVTWRDDDDSGSIELFADSGDEKKEKVIEILRGSVSVRKYSSPLVVANDPFLVLSATPAAVWYEDEEIVKHPLVVNSGGPSGDRFLQLYPHDDLTGIGDTGDFGGTISMHITGNREEISLGVAETFWESSRGAIIMGTGNESYSRSLPGIVLASYLDIPVIITDGLDQGARETLKCLGVKYTIVFDDSRGYGRTIRFMDLESIEDIVMQLLEDKLGGVSYVTLTNPCDLELDYALPGISSLAPYLTASHGGIVCAALEQPIPPGTDFRVEEDAFRTNETTFQVKEKLLSLMDRMRDHGLFQDYLENSPYLAVMGSAYSLPFYYTYLVPKGIMAGNEGIPAGDEGIIAGHEGVPAGEYQNINDPALVPSDDIYADIDGDFATHELAAGRPIGINLEDTSGLIARTLFYGKYMGQWASDSPVSMLLDASWKETAFVHCGDDWNGYVLISSPAYVESVEYLNRHDYTTYTTIGTGETVNEVTRFFQSSNLVFVLAHGNERGFHMIDGYSAADVKNWWVGPSSFVMTSCNVGNTDCPDLTDIDNSIAFAIIRAGINAYFSGMRYEYTGVYNQDDEYPLVASGSPRLSQIIIDKLTEEDLSSGLALRESKRQYMNELENSDEMDYDVAIKILYGDPMFNPYEPYNAC